MDLIIEFIRIKEEIKNRVKTLFEGFDVFLTKTDPEWVDIVVNFSQEEVIKENKLTNKEQMLSILSVLLGTQALGEYKNMLHAALKSGVDPVAIKETVYQATAYLGIGRVHDFLVATNKVMEEFGITLPLPTQKIVTEETRFHDGLEKQVSLFGPGMRKQQTDAPELRSNVNKWLANNCFGDYYTRNGLNDKEREMITFCFILAQGGCENQLRGHTAGNIMAGNDKAKLYSIVEQCMPYIGYPRTLNAMNIIDEVADQLSK